MSNLPPKPTTNPGLFYLDNFRTDLTSLVICHHTLIPYGGLGSWAYTSRFHISSSSCPLIAFNAVNQSYFMGSLFFLSGAMSSAALNRKGGREFMRSKWLELGVPVVVYGLVGPPLSAVLRSMKGEAFSADDLVTHWKGLRGVRGPVWYIALLVFDAAFSLAPRSSLEPLARLSLLSVFPLDIAGRFIVRLWYPIGEVFVPLNL